MQSIGSRIRTKPQKNSLEASTTGCVRRLTVIKKQHAPDWLWQCSGNESVPLYLNFFQYASIFKLVRFVVTFPSSFFTERSWLR